MIDTSISPDPETGDRMTGNVELPVNVETITIDGIQPAVGDHVEVKVDGTVTRVVNSMAYVRPEMVNDQPMPSTPLQPDANENEMDRLDRLSRMSDAETTY